MSSCLQDVDIGRQECFRRRSQLGHSEEQHAANSQTITASIFYMIQLTQEFKPKDHLKHRELVEWFSILIGWPRRISKKN